MNREVPIHYSALALVLVVFVCGYWLLSQGQKEVFENAEAGTGLNPTSFFVDGSIVKSLEDNFSFSAFGGHNFCSYYNFKQSSDKYPMNIWGVCSEYYQEDGNTVLGAVLSSPFQIVFDETTEAEKWLPVSENDYPKTVKSSIETVLFSKNKESADSYFAGVEKILDVNCVQESDCESTMPTEYLIKSNCPYQMKCLNNKCSVVCLRDDYNN